MNFSYIGKTTDDKICGCIGIWNVYQTLGLPIGIQIDKLWELGIVISWIHEYNIALWQGCKSDKIVSIFNEELEHSKYYSYEEVWNRLNSYIKQREAPNEFNLRMLKESKEIADGQKG